MTVRALLDWATRLLEEAGFATPRLDAEVILAALLGKTRAWLFTWTDERIPDEAVQAFHHAVQRRLLREPVHYIVGFREFYGLRLRVSPAVLIPRPETEILVTTALEWLGNAPGTRVLDLCTGSGAITLAVARNAPGATVVGTDLSQEALEVARQNSLDNALESRVEWRRGDLWDAVGADERFDLILANPPYVSENDFATLEPNVRDYEPRVALVAPGEGLAILRRIAEGAPAHLLPRGALGMEIGSGQGADVRALLEGRGYREIVLKQDLAGLDRVTWGRGPLE